MAASWTIAASTGALTVGAGGDADLTFRVTNGTDTGGYATVDVLMSDAASGSWFSVAHPHRWIAGRTTEPFTLGIAIPAHAMVGTHWVQGRVHSTDGGIAGGFAVSDRVTVTIVSMPVAMVEVPGVVDLPMFDAMRQIAEANLRVELVGNADQGWFDPAGGNVFASGDWYVLSQHPLPPTTVPADTTVTLYVKNRAIAEPHAVGPEIKIKWPRPWKG